MYLIQTKQYWQLSLLLVILCGCSSHANSTANGQSGKQQPATGTVHQVQKPIANESFMKHPFSPAVKKAKLALEKMDRIKDYSAILVKRERINGKLYDYSYMKVKIRHKPFSVYIKFLSSPKGREVIYVEGKHNNQLVAHSPGLLKLVGATWLKPTNPLAMAGNRYPLTKIGIRTMLKELVEVGEADMKFGNAKIKYFNNATVNNIPTKAFRFTHPIKNKNFRFNIAEVFMDKKTGLPIRYAAYDWPTVEGGKPVLLEEYTYLNLKLNVGLTDDDFDPKSEKYNFPK